MLQYAANDLFQGLMAPLGQGTMASNSVGESTELNPEVRQNRIKMLRKELIGPEMEAQNLRFEKLMTIRCADLKQEILEEFNRVQSETKEGMIMLEEVMNQMDSLSKKVRNNQALNLVSEESIDKIKSQISSIENQLRIQKSKLSKRDLSAKRKRSKSRDQQRKKKDGANDEDKYCTTGEDACIGTNASIDRDSSLPTFD